MDRDHCPGRLMTDPRHQYFEDPAITRLMGMVVALAGEVFVLKAQNERLHRTLKKKNVIGDEALTAVEEDKDLRQWLVRERDEFSKYLLMPLIEPDIAQLRHDQIFGKGVVDKAPMK